MRKTFGALCVRGSADVYGDHQVGCGGNGDRIHRHDVIRDALFSEAQTAALAPRKEASSLISGTSSRPVDVYLQIWKKGNGDLGCLRYFNHAAASHK